MQNPDLAQCLRDLRADPHNQSLKHRALDLMGRDRLASDDRSDGSLTPEDRLLALLQGRENQR